MRGTLKMREGGLLCFSFNVRVSLRASHSISTASYGAASACCNIIHCKYPAVIEHVDPSAESADRSDRGSNGIVRRPPDRRELMIGHRASHRQRGRQKSRCRAHAAERKGTGGESRARSAHRSHPRKLSRPPLMRGFGRHTSKVIAYLRDQVEPPVP